MSDFLQTFVQITVLLVALKAMSIGSDFNFYYLIKYKTKYLKWYDDRQTFDEFLDLEKEEVLPK